MVIRPNVSGFIYFLLLIVWLTFSSAALAQLQVVNSIPAHGATQVDTAATFSVEFSAPIDTSARFAYPEDFFLNLMLIPDSLVGIPDAITVSPDLRTVFFYNLHLQPNTLYNFIIVDAVSQSGDSLSQPFSYIFTTGSTLPGGSVSGTVSSPDGIPGGALVALFEAPPFGDESNPAATAVVQSNGNYTVDFVSDGMYWPVAVKNFFVDDSGEVDVNSNSTLGVYDADGDLIQDSIVVAGGSVSGVNIDLLDLYLQTARTPFPYVETAAQNWAADAALVQLFGEPEPYGEGLFWQYLFYSQALNSYRPFFVAGDFITAFDFNELFGDTMALPVNWIDSDSVLSVTEGHGGSDFRNLYPDAMISAGLVYLFRNGPFSKSQLDKRRLSILGKPVEFSSLCSTASVELSDMIRRVSSNQPVDIPAWVVQYYSETAQTDTMFFIGAESGEILNAPQTARAAEMISAPLALAWAGDARLHSMDNLGGVIDTSGASQFWQSFYYSASKDSMFVTITLGLLPVFAENPGFPPFDTTTVDANWLDSDVTVAVADAAGGMSFRQSHPNAMVRAGLSRWFFGPQPEKTVWQFLYVDPGIDSLEIIVDAVGGNLVGLHSPDDRTPERFTLHQNYPNPFNPATMVRFELPRAAHVTATIYNLLGQKVGKLVDRRLTAGSYAFPWKPQGLASGLYILDFRADDYHAEIKMFYLK